MQCYTISVRTERALKRRNHVGVCLWFSHSVCGGVCSHRGGYTVVVDWLTWEELPTRYASASTNTNQCNLLRLFGAGPRTPPIIGNLHQLPAKDLHLAYQEWGSKCELRAPFLLTRCSNATADGPIFHLKLGSQDTVVLTSGEMIKKVIDKKSANFADRPKLYMQDIWEGSRIIMRGYILCL